MSIGKVMFFYMRHKDKMLVHLNIFRYGLAQQGKYAFIFTQLKQPIILQQKAYNELDINEKEH